MAQYISTTQYKSRHYPDSGVTYYVVGDTLISCNGCEYGPDAWDYSDLERIEDVDA